MTDQLIRINVASGSPFEPLRGYSRAVQVGDQLFISGTTAMSAQGDVAAPNDPYLQTRTALAAIKAILTSRDFQLSDVVKTRLYVTNIARWDDYARAHREVFERIRPASSLVQVAKLVDPRLVVEIEVEAIRGVTDLQSDSVRLLSE